MDGEAGRLDSSHDLPYAVDGYPRLGSEIIHQILELGEGDRAAEASPAPEHLARLGVVKAGPSRRAERFEKVRGWQARIVVVSICHLSLLTHCRRNLLQKSCCLGVAFFDGLLEPFTSPLMILSHTEAAQI